MKQRLQTLLDSEKLTLSKFAEILEVNKSGISHLLSGRNNPSLDFLQKVLVKFPHINPDWLLLGQGNMYRNASKNHVSNNKTLFDINTPEKPLNKPEIDTSNTLTHEEKIIKPEEKKDNNLFRSYEDSLLDDSISNTNKSMSKLNNDKKIDKVLIFYCDGTFDSYSPNKN